MDAFPSRLTWQTPRRLLAATLDRWAPYTTLAPAQDALKSPAEVSRDDLRFVAWIAGLCGLFLGLGSGYQVPVESAQVVAGLVQYPAENPFYMYHVKTWTLLHQLPALWLWLGLDEQAASLIIGAVVGILSFEALGLTCLAISGHRWWSAAVPIVCVATGACKEAWGVYPIRVLSDAPWITYGAAGTSYALLVFALLSLKIRRLAALMMGLAPAVHPALGAWCLGIAALSIAWNWRREIAATRTYLVYGGAGLLVTIASFATQQLIARNVLQVPPEVQQQYLAAFAEHWDSHRRPFLPQSPVLWYGFATMVVGIVWLRYFAQQLPSSGAFLLRALLLGAVLGLLLAISTQFQSLLPQAVVMAIPGRFINVVGLAFPAALLGLILRYRGVLLVDGLLGGLLLHGVLRMGTIQTELYYVPPATRVLLVVALIMLYFAPRFFADADERERQWQMLHLIQSASLGGLIALAFVWMHEDFKLSIMIWVLVALTPTIARERPVPEMPALRLALRMLQVVAFVVITLGTIGLWLTLAIVAGVVGLFVLAKIEQSVTETSGATGCSSASAFSGSSLNPGPGTAGTVVATRGEGSTSGATAGLSSSAAAAAGGVANNVQVAPLRRFGIAATTLGVVLVLVCLSFQAITTYATLEDHRNDPVLAVASRGEGLLLTDPRLRSIQLRTRRPLLIEGAGLNQLPYVPASGPEMNRILNAIFADDIFRQRPFSRRHHPTIDMRPTMPLWENRTRREWLALAQEFGFSEIMTYDDWELDLPIVARTEKTILYRIPGAAQHRPMNIAARAARQSNARSRR